MRGKEHECDPKVRIGQHTATAALLPPQFAEKALDKGSACLHPAVEWALSKVHELCSASAAIASQLANVAARAYIQSLRLALIQGHESLQSNLCNTLSGLLGSSESSKERVELGLGAARACMDHATSMDTQTPAGAKSCSVVLLLALSLLDAASARGDEEGGATQALRLQVLPLLAACCLRAGSPHQAAQHASEAWSSIQRRNQEEADSGNELAWHVFTLLIHALLACKVALTLALVVKLITRYSHWSVTGISLQAC